MSVYFITCREIGMVKIGCSFDPFVRLRALQTAFPLELKIEAFERGSYKREKELHAQFAEHRVRGEWFRLCPTIEALLEKAETPERPRSIAAKRRLHEMDAEPRAPLPIPRRAPAADKPLPPSFDERRLAREYRRRIAEGDIHFPFREEQSADRIERETAALRKEMAG